MPDAGDKKSFPEPIVREFFLGFTKVHILYHAGQGAVYGLQLIEELGRHGYELSAGTLYPLLHSMERSGYLSRQDEVVGGKVRKYYRATPAGREALVEIRRKIREVVAEVLEGNVDEG